MRASWLLASFIVHGALAIGWPPAAAQDAPIAPSVRTPASAPAVSPSRTIDNDDDLAEAFEVYTGLMDGVRARHYFRRGLRLLERYSAAGAADELSDFSERLDLVRYSHDPKERINTQVDLATQQRDLAKRIAMLLPPVAAFDRPSDDGKSVVIAWRTVPGAKEIVIEKREVTAGLEKPWKVVKTIALRSDGKSKDINFDDKADRFVPNRGYQFRLTARDESGAETLLGQTATVTPRANWFSGQKFWYLWFVAILCLAVVYYIWLAQRGVSLKIRKIAGLEAVDDAVGRATEMGRPVLFIAGIQDMDNIQTVAGLTVLGRVARVAAEHDALLEVPTSRSLVMTAARETVHSAFLNAGRPDAYNEKKIYYVTDEQFGFVAATTGLIVREKPAACIYMGAFFAESLILAETANTVGSIQIAGTAEPAQLPFFVAACDYTLIGEEFFAASAYLSGEPRQLGSLKGQDVGKAIVMILTLVGTILVTVAVVLQQEHGVIGDLIDFLKQNLLSVAD